MLQAITGKAPATSKPFSVEPRPGARHVSVERKFSIGDRIPNNDGSLAGICMSFQAPYWMAQAGIVVAIYSADEQSAAFEHYDFLVAQDRRARGIKDRPPVIAEEFVPVPALVDAGVAA